MTLNVRYWLKRINNRNINFSELGGIFHFQILSVRKYSLDTHYKPDRQLVPGARRSRSHSWMRKAVTVPWLAWCVLLQKPL